MYWITWGESGTIYRSWMDGSHPTPIVTGIRWANDLAINAQESRLYWTTGNCPVECPADYKIWSSDMGGGNVKTFLQRPAHSDPVGIGFYKNRVYWTDLAAKTLGSSDKFGQSIQQLHTDTAELHRLVVVAGRNVSTDRANDCAHQKCTNVCALTPKSFVCV